MEVLRQKLKTTLTKLGRRSSMSEMMALKDHKGVELGQLMESIMSLASPSKMTKEKPLDEAPWLRPKPGSRNTLWRWR